MYVYFHTMYIHAYVHMYGRTYVTHCIHMYIHTYEHRYKFVFGTLPFPFTDSRTKVLMYSSA